MRNPTSEQMKGIVVESTIGITDKGETKTLICFTNRKKNTRIPVFIGNKDALLQVALKSPAEWISGGKGNGQTGMWSATSAIGHNAGWCQHVPGFSSKSPLL